MIGTMAIAGALGGAVLCGLAVHFGGKAAMQSAVNDEQRQTLRQILAGGSIYAAVVMAIILLTAFQVLPRWGYMMALVLWFGPLFPALTWAHHQLDAAAGRADLGQSLSAA